MPFIDELPDIEEVRLTFGRRSLDRQADHYIIYCRESDDRDERNKSVTDQVSLCEDFAQRNNLHVIAVITERMSARAYGRPRFTNILRAMKGEEALDVPIKEARKLRPDGFIAWHPDRLARNWRDAGEIIEMLDNGTLTDMKFLMYSFHNDSSGKEHLAMEFARAKGYSDHLQDNVMRGLIQQEQQGKATKPIPPAFATLNDEGSPDHLKIIPSRLHQHWRSVYRWRLEGKTFDEIAALLIEEGYEDRRKRKGKTFPIAITGKYIGHHIGNPLHCGLYVTEGGKEPRKADLTRIYPQEFGEDFPVVVSLDEFKKVNPELFSDTAGGRRPVSRRTDYPLAGKVFCTVLHGQKLTATMTANAPKGGSGIPSPRFSCQRCKPSHSLHMEEIYKAVEKKLKTVKITPRLHKLMIVTEWERYKRDREQMKTERKRLNTLKANNDKKIEEAEEILNRMKYRSQKATKREIEIQQRVLTRMHEDQKNLNKQIAKLDEDSIERYYDLDAFLELAKNAYRWWKKATEPQKRRMADIIISNVMVEGGKVASVTLNEPFEECSEGGEDLDGRGERTRTFGLTVPNRALYQLSYAPNDGSRWMID